MKFMHLSDLHLGIRVHEYSMIEDQKHILKQILSIIEKEQIEILLLAGDIYDKAIPPVDAITLFDEFLVSLSQRQVKVFVISGNHDSTERLTFGSKLMDQNGVYFAPIYNGKLHTVTVKDEYGKIDISMLPFIKPIHVRPYFPDAEINTYTDAVKQALEDTGSHAPRRVLMTHQFVTGASKCESEDITVGGLDNVDAAVFEDFDYVALGHIHSPQNVTKETIRFCGTPLKYSFSEADQEKSATIVTLKEKGNVTVETIPLIPKRDLVPIRGTYDELTNKNFYENTTYTSDYVGITLTDEEDVPDAVGRLQVIYKNLMKLDYDNTRTRKNQQITLDEDVEKKSPLELFNDLYEMQNNQPMSDAQREFTEQLWEKIMEGNE